MMPSRQSISHPPRVKRFLVLGLDSVPPELAFDKMLDFMPNLRSLLGRSTYGPMMSTIPPITVPAWSSMMTSQDPGQLGFYGFRNRADHSYQALTIANSLSLRKPRVWEILSRLGKQVIIVGVPQTYPAKPINGSLITGFLTPDITSQYTYPTTLRGEVEQVVGRYILDVENFRTDDKEALLRNLYEMMEKRFKLFRHLLQTKSWDFAMIVAMAPDRLHHGFWKFYDPEHPKHDPGNPFLHCMQDFYQAMDAEIGEILELMDDETGLLIVSDHGIKRMDGGICVNEWLMREGYLSLEEQPRQPIRFSQAKVDWTRTKAWGEGGYYARIFLNVEGREPQGTVRQADYEAVRDALIARLEEIVDPEGRNIGTRVFKPQAIYRECNNIAPDLIVYFGDLHWRSIGTIGLGSIHTFENDTGPDDANHSQYGICVLTDPGADGAGYIDGITIMDVAPTILDRLGVDIPSDMIGKPIEGGSSCPRDS